MENTAQWIMIAGWIGIGATFMQMYKTGLALFVVAFALAMLPPGHVDVPPLAVGVIVFYAGAALMGGYILLQIWRWCGKDGW